LRVAALSISVILVLGSLFIIVMDRPSPTIIVGYFGPTYSCPTATSLVVLTVPTMDVTLKDKGYSADFNSNVASQGKGLCKVFYEFPTDSTPISDGTYATKMRETTSSNRLLGRVAVGTAPRYSPNWRRDIRFSLAYSFESTSSTGSGGWGIENFGLDTGTIPRPALAGDSAFPALAPEGESRRSFDLSVHCPVEDTNDNIVNVYPNNAALSTPVEAVWQVEPKGIGQLFIGKCQDQGVRFWVGHATDGMVLGLGALLGVLVTRNDDPEPRIRSTGLDGAQTNSEERAKPYGRWLKVAIVAIILLRSVSLNRKH
jgi:hypothetical protein